MQQQKVKMISKSGIHIQDPTVDLINNLEFQPFEIGIGVVLLTYAVIAETLAFFVHRLKDKTLPITRLFSNFYSDNLILFPL